MGKKLVSLNLFFLFFIFGCKTITVSLLPEEQNQIIETTINIEKDSSLGKINAAKDNSRYLVSDQFHDSIFVDTSMTRLINKTISIEEIQEKYKKALNKNNKLISDSFDVVHISEYSNKTLDFLSFSKPIKYGKYYLVNFFFSSWASGYKTALIFKKNVSGQFNLIYRRIYSVR